MIIMNVEGCRKMRLLKKRIMIFNETLLSMIGKPYGEIKKVWGEAEGIYAYGGEIGFLFENTVFYYFMDEYDINAAQPKDGSVCYGASCRLDTCVEFMENRMYSFDELRDKLNVDIQSYSTDEEDEMGVGFEYTHEFTVGNLNFRLYSDSITQVSSGSIIIITKVM